MLSPTRRRATVESTTSFEHCRAGTPTGRAQVDRFIPSRSALDLDVAHYNLSREGGESEVDDAVKEIKSPAKVRASTRSKRARTNAWSE